MMAVPAMMPAPVTVAPTPMPVVPTPMTVMPAPVMAMPPSYLLGLKPLDLLSADHGGLGFLARVAFREWLRKERRGLRSCIERDRCGYKSNGEFQKVPAFHARSPVLVLDAARVLPRRSE
jgi:hypothetical protein